MQSQINQVKELEGRRFNTGDSPAADEVKEGLLCTQFRGRVSPPKIRLIENVIVKFFYKNLIIIYAALQLWFAVVKKKDII